MAHMIKGNGAMQQQRAIVQQQQAPQPQQKPAGTVGVIVGAVVNKPGSNPSGIQVTSTGTALIPGVVTPVSQNTPGILQVSSEQLKAGGAVGGVNLANTKEKTPMCLVNELARYNKIQHQYTLTDEQGPAHQKTFYVKLKLGNEEYAANGASIKKAQHAAAGIALEQTQHPKPPVKIPRPQQQHYGSGHHQGGHHGGHGGRGGGVIVDPNQSVTPTVELNALVMKRGEQAQYRPIDMPRQPYYPQAGAGQVMQGGAIQGNYNHMQRSGYGKYPRTWYVALKIGQREFIGEGNSRQSARHNAADKALKMLKTLPLPTPPEPTEKPEETQGDDEASGGNGTDNELKSEISLVHEIALKRSLSVSFEVIRESGPPHLKNFLTRCSCGNISVDGEGNSKKTSKKRAAEAMLEKLRGLPPLPQGAVKPKKPPQKKKNRNLIKIQKASPEYGSQMNPISRLIQIQQAKKEKEPVYTLVEETGKPRKREFVIQVTVGDQSCNGSGPNKKLAKRAAAELMLQQLGYSKPAPQPAKPAIKQEPGVTQQHAGSGGDKKVTFIDQDTGATRQLVPGVILMPNQDKNQIQIPPSGYGVQAAHIPGRSAMAQGNHSPQTIASIARELLETRQSPTAEAIRQRSQPNTIMAPLIRPEQQLFYMGEVLGFAVIYTDFPKGNKNEFLSLVTLSTQPSQVSHGAGPNREASHDMAAHQALRALALFDTPAAADVKPDHRGDGFHVKTEPIA